VLADEIFNIFSTGRKILRQHNPNTSFKADEGSKRPLFRSIRFTSECLDRRISFYMFIRTRDDWHEAPC
jgi:hypothetical protein